MEKKYKILIGIVIASMLFIAYQSLVVVPREELAFQKQKIANAELSAYLEKVQKEADYKTCKDAAYETYSLDWNQGCRTAGKANDCTLPKYTADTFDQRLSAEKNRCVTMYK